MNFIFGAGYIGSGEYSAKDSEGKNTIQYQYWINMIERCYKKKISKKDITYEDKYVCKEWLCFQTFAKWFDENYYECNDGYLMHLDKDILNKGNKIYSPNNCVFVSHRINNLFTKRQNYRGKYPIGVDFNKGQYRAKCSILENNKSIQKVIGYFNNPDDAFYKGYKPFKEGYIKQLAEEYKNIIPQNLYIAMINYVVEITD